MEKVCLISHVPRLTTLPRIECSEEEASEWRKCPRMQRRPNGWTAALIPGRNHIPAAYWTKVAELPTAKGPGRIVSRWLEEGDFSVSFDPRDLEKREGPEPPKSLRGMDEEMALRYAQDEFDLETLERWEPTARGGVRQVIREKIARLT